MGPNVNISQQLRSGHEEQLGYDCYKAQRDGIVRHFVRVVGPEASTGAGK